MQRMVGLALGLVGMASVGLAMPAVGVQNPDPGRTYIVDCQGELEYKPKEIVLACGDAGAYVDKIKWSKWNMNRAVGRGILNYKTCQPDCSSGDVLTYKVRLRLEDPATGPGKGTFVNTFSSLTGAVADGPRPSRRIEWMLINPID